MYSTEVEVRESLNPIEDLIIINSTADKELLVPDNRAEVIIPLDKGMTIKRIGHSKDVLLNPYKGYFLMPRGRGLEIKSLSKKVNCLIVKVNPLYAKKMTNSLVEISHSVFEMNFDKCVIEESLKSTQLQQSNIGLQELLFELLDIPRCTYESISTIILESIEKIRYSSGAITIKEIYSSLNVSKSKLEQYFNREIGLTPKEFCKIEKINFFIKSYNEQLDKSLTELTYECGYYDQSHLIKDFKYFLDTSPSKFLKSNYAN